MENLKLLGLCGLCGAGVVGAACTGYVFIQPKNVSEELSKRGKVPLTFDGNKDDAVWQKLLEKHKQSNGSNNPPKISGFTDSSADIKALKEKCKTLLLTKKGDSNWDSSYIDASNWCVKPESSST
ncbi:hypothetical protein MHC_02510 [Mycoplasma haemocanis str. Illinois]|uniref:Lipoprotein n=1 Tax=Mycoplasma haemocanis (strain Illinois) TaxID=1111676 RepID=H6N6U4_MYCHN|nr:hypothetical protein [Mycoplasma haemocanis]AEW45366.1 hypothetical protein MHC_02510 [Mycoplasma haemocanis str. Illinois]